MNIKYFEEVSIQHLEDYYSRKIEIGNRIIKVDLNFTTESIDEEELRKINDTLSKLEQVIKISWTWIMDDFKNGEDVKEFISFHLEDFFEDDPEEILQGTDVNLSNEERFLQTLRVNRIGIYPSDSETYMVIDWMTDPELSNYILVINLNASLKLNYITVES